MLQIADTDTGNIYIPADDGFGIDTSSFVWSTIDNRLFAITGDKNSKQLLCYDLQSEANPTVCALTEEEYMESSLCLFGDSIYYLRPDTDSLKTSIYRANIETGHGARLLQGNSFALSPDGENVLVNDMQYDNVDEYSFYIYVNSANEKHIIESGKMIMDYAWSPDSTRVYYTVYKNAGWEEEFPLQLYYYDITTLESHYVMDMITGALYTAQQADEVLVMSIFQLQDKPITITYKVK